MSNAFYALWLDKEMVYTCAYCTDWDNDIDQMQQDKLEMICRKLRLKPGEKMLDIGCGWGALSCYAAQNYGVTTLGVTLSTQQVEYAKAKAERLGLADRVTFELADYATVKGKFDKVAAIGIQEHIGIDNYPTYYKTVKRVLKKNGLFLHHAITKPAKKDDRTFRKKNEEFKLLTKHIFPGGELDHIGNTVTMLERHGFEVHDVRGLARTLPAYLPALARPVAGQLRCRGGGGRRGQDPPLAGLSRRLFQSPSNATACGSTRRWCRTSERGRAVCRRHGRTSTGKKRGRAPPFWSCYFLFCRFSIRSSTTAGSARVDVSPSEPKSSSAILRRMRRMILPERVFGRPGRKLDEVGRGDRPDFLRTCLTSSLRSASLLFSPASSA